MNRFALLSSNFFNASQVWRLITLAAMGIACMNVAKAEMIIDTTRLIYPEFRREISFKVTNISKDRSSLVQMWVDDGVNISSPEDVVTPFNVSPPVAKVNLGANQVVRINYTGDPLPTDRESVFWFNLLEVPPKSNAENKLTFAMRTRIKLFYRPKSLKGDPSEYMSKVKWKVVQKEGKWFIEGDNPSPFHMSFAGLNLGDSTKNVNVADGGMLNPMSQGSFPIPAPDKIPKTYAAVVANFINDFGGVAATAYPVSPAK